ncbi:hypothetical protein D0867_03214 [Hortaea werneckii]|uniref:Uncharacterized protein n=1 Tax=Hortaea werneckii TaxID=91943 RepID=A0A3M7BCH1_HORWE|nr:hypothetical protein D0867_03214 [Hortaea werneckii]RMY37509.1 hypothetical protein D0866_03224 [Hortaea werneckii]
MTVHEAARRQCFGTDCDNDAGDLTAFAPVGPQGCPSDLRPVYPLSPKRHAPKTIQAPDWAASGVPKAEQRLNRSKIAIFNSAGQEAMRRVSRLAREVLDATAAEIRPGVATDYLHEVCHHACMEPEIIGLRRTCTVPSLITESGVSFASELQPLP